MTNWDDLISGEDLQKKYNYKKRNYEREVVKKGLIDDYLKSGWEIHKEYSSGSAEMRKPKKIGDSFEDEVWSIFYKMGFKTMNSSRNFTISTSENNANLTQQIDVIAIDDEVVLIIECKETEKLSSNKSWKNELDAIENYKGKVIRELKKKYPNHKYVFIFATKNYVFGTQDKERLKDHKIIGFEYDTVQYYSQLADHLGTAARYQLLASIFAKQEIPGMDNRVPAIEGKMGGHTYYAFSIEPEKLLKISYILHRNNANRENMPTYQRLIKKERLKGIREFINMGGYFPNSVIISIDSGNRNGKLQFDLASNRVEGSISRIGILHLPNTYQSAYVIDGQHRLYGYSDSDYGTTNSIPVVAFVDLDKREQVRMFMDINENQKAVPKALRNTLNIDMLWDSPKYIERNNALMLDIAQKLGENKQSALYGRVVTGENSTTEVRCITLEYIRDALNKTKFFNEYRKNNDLSRQGTIAKDNNNDTESVFLPFINKYFNDIRNYCSEEWDKNGEGFLAINNTTFGLIKILDDIVNIQLEKDNIAIINNTTAFYKEIENTVREFCNVINELSEEQKQEIKTAKGGSAKNTAWHILQVAFHNKCPSFTSAEIENYIKTNCNDYKESIQKVYPSLESGIIEPVKNILSEHDNWLRNMASQDLRDDLGSKKGRIEANEGRNVDYLELISFKEIAAIAKNGNNWSNCIRDIFNEEERKITKEIFLKDMNILNNIEDKVNKDKKISYEDYEAVKQIIGRYGLPVNLEDCDD